MPDQHHPPKTDLTGTDIDGYPLTALISASQFSAQYRTEQLETSQSAALHLFFDGFTADPTFAHRFQQICAELQSPLHPDLPHVQSFGTCAHGYYLVADEVDGQNITTRMGQGRLSRIEIIDVMKDVCTALDVLRKNGIPCAYISPADIFVSADGRVSLNPFNILNIAAESPALRMACATETPYYVAPELLSGETDFRAADVYSIGVTLFEMIAGTPPYVDSSAWKVWKQHVSAPIPNLQDFAPYVPDMMRTLVAQMLAKSPVDRPTNLPVMAETMQSVWQSDDDTHIDTTGTTVLPQILHAEKPIVAHRTAVRHPLTIVAGVLIVLIIAGVWWLRRPIHSVAPPAAAVATPTRTATIAHSATIPPKKITDTPPVIAPVPTETPLPTATASPTPSPTETVTPLPSPTVTPENTDLLTALRGEILFKTNRNGRVDIFQMDEDGSNQIPLAIDRAYLYNDAVRWESFSPGHGQTLVVRGPGQFDVWLVDLTGGSEQRLTSHPAADYDPVWSPGGNRAIFVSERTGNGDLYMYDFGDNGIYRLTDDGASFDKHPSWSADGTWLVFGSNRGGQNRQQIWRMKVDDGSIINLSQNDFEDWDPVWVK